MEQALSVVPETNVLCLLRVGWPEHLEQFKRGKIRFRNVTYYSNLETQGQTHHDSDEQVAAVLQAEQIKLHFKTPSQTVEISAENGLVGQVVIRSKRPRMVCCMHAIHTGEWTNREFTEKELPEFRAFLDVPTRMAAYGDHVWWVTNADQFRARLFAAAERDKFRLRSKLVRYVDFQTVHGNIPERLQAFVKSSKFADEREYRIELRSSKILSDPFEWDVGDLSDVSSIVSLKKFRKTFKIAFPED